jgi:hypothetical protein
MFLVQVRQYLFVCLELSLNQRKTALSTRRTFSFFETTKKTSASMHMYNVSIHVKFTCVMYYIHVHVKYTCSMLIYNAICIYVKYTCAM